jgi:hypothetical protein
MAGEQGLFLQFGQLIAANPQVEVVYNPGLRPLGTPLKALQIYSVPPNTGRSYQQEMDLFFQSEAQALVECSALDTWHTTTDGLAALPKIRKTAYRVVIFDGGHHLSTLGMAPDVIIVPAYKGYAVHGYMKDGIKVETIKKLLEKSKSPTILVTVSRWHLVKNETCMKEVCKKVFEQLSFRSDAQPDPVFTCRLRMSRWGDQVYIYLDKGYYENKNLLLKNCGALQVKGSDQVYLACDYGSIQPADAEKTCHWLKQKLGVPIECVNDPVKVLDLIF